MKLKYLTLLFLICLSCLNKAYPQNLKLENLAKLSILSLEEFQEYMYENQFFFLHANTNSKTDTISFINKQDVITGFIRSKKGNTIFVKNIKEDYFRELNNNLKSPDFILVSTKVMAKKILEKTYIHTATENIIKVYVISDLEKSNKIENTYKTTISKPNKSLYRNYLSKANKDNS